jgi:hypothetical protein
MPSIADSSSRFHFITKSAHYCADQAATFIDTNIDLTTPQRLAGEPVYERKFNCEQFDESATFP